MNTRNPTSAANPHDLLVLLAVARNGRFTSAAHVLGLNHTTVARRIESLESALGGRVLTRDGAGWTLTELGARARTAAEAIERAMAPLRTEPDGLSGLIRMSATDGFSGFVAAPAMAEMRREHPRVTLELVTGTRQANSQRVGADLEVVVGRPVVRNAHATELGEYALGLYASRAYLAEHGTPSDLASLQGRPLVYFIESMLRVDALDEVRTVLPPMVDAVASTNVYVHVEATRAGAGFGLLPAFLADRADDLVRLLPDEIGPRLPYWLIAREDALRHPVVAAYVRALRDRMAAVRPQLLGDT